MRIKKVAVLGAGTMGAQIAAHFANASVPSLLFDMPGLAAKAVDRLKKIDPAPFFLADLSSLIEPLDFGSAFSRLKEVDWIIEAVVEDLEAKRNLLQSILPYLRPDTIITSNTSGLPVGLIAELMPSDFKRRWFGTHFFNPPRYLKLLELIPTPDTDAAVLQMTAHFAECRLGKGIVWAKDTPNFVANRLATFGGMQTLKVMLEEGYSIEEVDALTGPIMGRPKTGTFRLFDLVGIDVFAHVAENLRTNLPQDEQKDIFQIPLFIQKMVDRRFLGAKTGQGFYKKSGAELTVIDPETLEYRPLRKPVFPSVEMLKPMEDPLERIKALVHSKERAGEFVWKTLSAFLSYTAMGIPEISDDILNVDRAMKWGFGWSHGPFEIWDGLGLAETVGRMEDDGLALPAWLRPVLNQTNPRFYKIGEGHLQYWDVGASAHQPIPPREGVLVLKDEKQKRAELKRNAGASILDLGDGILCLEFHSKLNTIGADTMQMARAATEMLENGYEGLLIANQGENFSAGANLMLVLLEAQEGNWDELNQVVKSFQQMAMAFRQSSKPVIAVPFGLTLGGGCEVCLGCDAVHSASEVYAGLPEVAVGLLPAGGGTKEMLARQMETMPPGADPLPYLRKAFETIAMGKVSRSVLEAKALGYFKPSDTFSMNSDRLIRDAKNVILQLSQTYVPPQPRRNIPLSGRAGFAYLQLGIYLTKEAGFISDHDAKIGHKIAWVMTGGDLSEGAQVDEQFVLDAEREAFLSLLGERKSQERIQHMLKTGKPLRN